MKVRMKYPGRTGRKPESAFGVGDIVDISEREAKSLVARGSAEIWDEPGETGAEEKAKEGVGKKGVLKDERPEGGGD